ncbi:MAG: hypothetical protein IJ741_02025 [Schwartzia sp.]|nr:hypothetical protein [Schwartzia sp. (in: firmicutes)]
MGKSIALLLCVLIFCTGCGSDSRNTQKKKEQVNMSAQDILNKPLSKAELENLRQDSAAYLKTYPDNINHKVKIQVLEQHIAKNDFPSEGQIMLEVENAKRMVEQKRQEEAEAKKRQEAANVFQYSDFTLEHQYNRIIAYNGIKMSFVVQNVSNRVQTLRLKDFILKKSGSNTISPETALRNHTGIARNPENPDFSDYESELNQREMYPGDRFLVKIEFWEQRELIRSMEGWYLVHVYQNNARTLTTLHD